MKTILPILIALLCFGSTARAQIADEKVAKVADVTPTATEGGVILRIGGGANYYYGTDNFDYDQFEYQDNKLSFELDGLLGYQTRADKKKKSNIFGLFGRAGTVSSNQLAMYFRDQDLVIPFDSAKAGNNFQELEFGVLAQKTLRLSAGYGWLSYYDTEHKPAVLNYYSATVGFSIPLGPVRWNIDMTAASGKDYNKLVFRPSSSIVIHFD